MLKIYPKEEEDKRATGAKKKITNFVMSLQKLEEKLDKFTNTF